MGPIDMFPVENLFATLSIMFAFYFKHVNEWDSCYHDIISSFPHLKFWEVNY